MDLKSRTLMIRQEGNLYYVGFPSFERTGKVHHGFSTRRGGVSTGYFASMNLGFTRGDDPEAVSENYYRMALATGIYLNDMVASHQVHGDTIMYVDQQYRGNGITKPNIFDGVDGLITDKKHVGLVTIHADCVPVFFLDPVKEVIGLAHAGWKGTVLQIGARMVRRMKEDFGCDPDNILTGIGPSIGSCCFEVGSEVAEQFLAIYGEGSIVRPGVREGKYMVDLWEANRISLVRAGIAPEHITVTDLCTKCLPEYFHSHRYSGNNRGTMAAFLELY